MDVGALGDLTTVADEVEGTLELDELVRALDVVVDVQGTVDHTVLHGRNDQLTLCIELVVANADGSAVGIGSACDLLSVQVGAAVLDELAVIAGEVVGTVMLNELV